MIELFKKPTHRLHPHARGVSVAEWNERERRYRERKSAEIAAALANEPRQPPNVAEDGGRPVQVGNTKYRSCKLAARSLNVSVPWLRYRLDKQYPGFKWL